MDYREKYLKYKNKYLQLQLQYGGANCLQYGFQQHSGECWHDALGMLMMQSDLTSDNFIANITTLNLDEKQRELEIMFSPQNIDRNAYLLPFEFYMYYLNNKDITKNNISEIITKFLRLSKEYISNHKRRVQNRIQYDPDMSRYKVFPTQETIAKDKITAENFIQQMQVYRAMNPDMIIPTKENYARELTNKQRQEYIKDSQSVPRSTRLQRADSTNTSYVCTRTIIQIYNLIIPEDKKRADYMTNRGGNSYHSIIAYEILLLYLLNTKYNFYLSYNRFIFKTDILNKLQVSKTLQVLNSENLIGIDVGVGIQEPNDHAISLYKCDNIYKLYDDNVPYGVLNVNWKTSFHTGFINILNDRLPNIAYPLSKSALETYGLQILNYEQLEYLRTLNKDKLKEFATNIALGMINDIKMRSSTIPITLTEIPQYVDSGNLDNNIRQIETIYMNLYTQLYKINPQYIMNLMPPPIIDKIIPQISQIQISSVDQLLFILKNDFKTDEHECEYIINKLDLVNIKLLLKRLFMIKNITKDNCKIELLKFFQKYNIFNFEYMYYVVNYFNNESEVISFDDEKMILYTLLETTPYIINNVTYVKYFTENRISLHLVLKLYLMNTDISERILDLIKQDSFKYILDDLDRLLSYDPTNEFLLELRQIKEFYNPITNKFENQTLNEILENYNTKTNKIINHTGSRNKQELINRLSF